MIQPKRVRVALAARLRAEWSAVVEVPGDASESELAALVDQFFHTIEMDEYVQDDEYWGKGERGVKDNVDDNERVAYRATRDASGKLVYHNLATQPASLWCVVHGEEFVPEMFPDRETAEAFKERCPDYVSGPWKIETN
jgi:hypothetical protein